MLYVPKVKSKKLAEIYLEEIKFNNGTEVHYVSFKSPESVAVLPILDEQTIILVKQFRYAINEYSWEIPAGGINKSETNIDAAKRELEEETCYSSENLDFISSFYPSNAMSNEQIHIYSASFLVKETNGLKKEILEKDLEVKSFSFSNLMEMINAGKITDAATLIALQSLFIKNG